MNNISTSEIDQYMQRNKNFFEHSEYQRFRNIIGESNITLQELNTFKHKSPSLGIMLSVFLGFLGIDRFYAGNPFMGIVKLCTLGCWGVWWVIDWFLIATAIRRNNQSHFYLFLKQKTGFTY